MLRVVIDRPAHSRHPVHGFVYPVNYGFLPGVISGDGEELDAYVLGIREPVTAFSGICTAVIHRITEDDDKLVIIQPESSWSDPAIRSATYFQEKFFHTVIYR
jgi:inorganic pyrophosphatase